MKAYFDTSVLVKLYYSESDSNVFVEIVNSTTQIYLSEIAKIEFLSAVWKKVRMEHIDELTCKTIIECFENDFQNYEWIAVDTQLLDTAKNLLSSYGKLGLRTLDSLQLASALQVKSKIDKCYSTDILLTELFGKENL